MPENTPSMHRTKVCVRDLSLLADIGINPDEIGRRQPLVISVELLLETANIVAITETVDYCRIVAEAEELAKSHIPLIETFAHRLADRCLALKHVVSTRIRIDKPFAIRSGIAGVEVELARDQG